MPIADDIDPKGLIRESYRIDGISGPECRSIFLDWAIGVPEGVDSRDHVRQLLDHYGPGNPDHPMTAVLTAALAPRPEARRKGGARGRRAN